MSSNLDRYRQKYTESEGEIVQPLKKSPRFIKTEEHSIGGDVHTRKLHEEYYDETERITHVDDYEDVPREDEETLTMKEGRILKHERKQKFFDKNTKTIVTRNAVDEFTPVERHEEISSLGGNIYKREITESFYDSESNAMVHRHGVDMVRLDCGHAMHDHTAFGGRCCICGASQCDNCGTMVNGRVFCKAHVLNARYLLR